MSKYSWYTPTTEEFNQLTIKGLKPLLNTEGSLHSWTYCFYKFWKENWNICIELTKWDTTWTLRVYFTKTGYKWEETKLDYNIELVSTPCNYGWLRWWFLCPCKWNRCSILYL